MEPEDKEFQLTKEQIEAVKWETEKWQEFLNLTIGMLAFTMAISILGLKPKLQIFGAWAAFCFLVALILPNMRRWPPTLRALKDKKNRTEAEEIIFKGLMAQFFGASAILKNFSAYWIGMAALIALGLGCGEYLEKIFR